MYEQILHENADWIVYRASHTHPGFDSGIDVARRCGGVMMGYVLRKGAANGCDCFGRASLEIICVMADDSIIRLYMYAWRWSESGQRNVLGWWYGDGEWDVESIQEYGPVQDEVQS